MSSGNSKLCGALTKLDTFKPLPGVQLARSAKDSARKNNKTKQIKKKRREDPHHLFLFFLFFVGRHLASSRRSVN